MRRVRSYTERVLRGLDRRHALTDGLRAQEDRSFTRYVPRRVRMERCTPQPAIRDRLAAPLQAPALPRRRCDQWLRHGRELEVRSKIDDQQPITCPAHVADHERLGREHRAVEI